MNRNDRLTEISYRLRPEPVDRRTDTILQAWQAPLPRAAWPVASHPKLWLRQVQDTVSLYYRAIGSAEVLMAKAEPIGQAWMKGVAGEVARKILRERPT